MSSNLHLKFLKSWSIFSSLSRKLKYAYRVWRRYSVHRKKKFQSQTDNHLYSATQHAEMPTLCIVMRSGGECHREAVLTIEDSGEGFKVKQKLCSCLLHMPATLNKNNSTVKLALSWTQHYNNFHPYSCSHTIITLQVGGAIVQLVLYQAKAAWTCDGTE